MKSLINALCLLALFNISGDSFALQESGAGEGKAKPETFVKNIEAEDAARILKKNKGIVILDIRTPGEFKGGHLADAKNLDFYESGFQAKLKALDKKKTYLVHCASGGRSAKAREMMKKMGFEKLYHLEGGIRGWVKAGKPVEK